MKKPSGVRRCPACGHRIGGGKEAACSLCGFVFDFGADRVTGDDVTPYAQAYSLGERGLWRMCEWLWYAGTQRLKHLAMMRSSVASRRFARTNLALLTLGLALFQITLVGWRPVKALAELEQTGSTQPAGQGWYHVAAAPRPLPTNHSGEVPVDLWWNVPQAALGAVLAMLFGLILSWFVMWLLRSLVGRAHGQLYSKERRMTAALQYGTAWTLPVFVGSLLYGLLPFSYMGAMTRWSWCPPRQVFVISAAVVAGFGACMWWFWMIRLGSSAPPKVRGRVTFFMGVGAPVIVVAASAGWYFGIKYLHQVLTGSLRIGF